MSMSERQDYPPEPLHYRPGPPDAEQPPVEPQAQPGEPPKTECPECGKMISVHNLRAHRRKLHDVGRLREFKPRPAARKDVKAKTKEKAKVAHTPPAEPVTSTVDFILTRVVEARWPQNMPTRKALEMVQVRLALEKFLER